MPLPRSIPPGSEVRLELDADPTDRYGRTLAYVESEDGTEVNLELVTEGFATDLVVAPNDERAEELADAEADARAAGRGLWSACSIDAAGNVVPLPVAPPSSQAVTGAPPTTPATAPPATTAPLDTRPPPSQPPPTLPPDTQPPATVSPIDPVAGSGCDAAYPDVCIPSPPPDLDCGDIPYRRFAVVVHPDPHGFDGDDDGIGCES